MLNVATPSFVLTFPENRKPNMENSSPMSFIQTCASQFSFPRGKTDDLVARIAALPDPHAALAWRPGPGRRISHGN
ncbi:MAG: hypothetical protein QM811_22050 [Pirellulales bacterium]